jgi:1-deoxy-D-xylulose-5-phosphate synthase
LTWGRGEWLRQGKDAVILGIGSRVLPALEAAEQLAADLGREVGVLNLRFVKPAPTEDILAAANQSRYLLVVEENAAIGGAGAAVLECLAENDALSGLQIRRLGLPDSFVAHGPQKALRAEVGLDIQGIRKAMQGLWQS